MANRANWVAANKVLEYMSDTLDCVSRALNNDERGIDMQGLYFKLWRGYNGVVEISAIRAFSGRSLSDDEKVFQAIILQFIMRTKNALTTFSDSDGFCGVKDVSEFNKWHDELRELLRQSKELAKK